MRRPGRRALPVLAALLTLALGAALPGCEGPQEPRSDSAGPQQTPGVYESGDGTVQAVGKLDYSGADGGMWLLIEADDDSDDATGTTAGGSGDGANDDAGDDSPDEADDGDPADSAGSEPATSIYGDDPEDRDGTVVAVIVNGGEFEAALAELEGSVVIAGGTVKKGETTTATPEIVLQSIARADDGSLGGE